MAGTDALNITYEELSLKVLSINIWKVAFLNKRNAHLV